MKGLNIYTNDKPINLHVNELHLRPLILNLPYRIDHIPLYYLSQSKCLTSPISQG